MAIIFGTIGADTITDTVNSNGGARATAGNDEIYGGPDGADSLAGGGGNDLLQSSFGASTLDGGIGNDSLYGSDGGQHLIGGAGNDSLEGAAGADTIEGGSGADSIHVDNDIGGSTLAEMDSIIGFSQAEGDRLSLEGPPPYTTPLYWRGALPAASAVAALTAGFALPGGAPAGGISGHWVPRLGGDGWLVFDYDRGGTVSNADLVVFVDTTSDGPLTFGAFDPLDLTTTGSAGNDSLNGIAGLFDAQGGHDSIIGSSEADTLTGAAGDDSLAGGLGSDSAVFGGNAADYLVADLGGGLRGVTDLRPGAPDGADTLSGIEFLHFADAVIAVGGPVPTEGADTLAGTAGADRIDALGGNDLVNGLGGADSLFGNAGEDTLAGGDAADTLDGGTGADSLAGGAGDDLFLVDDALDKVLEGGGAGADTVRASITFTLGGNLEDLQLAGADTIGGNGNGGANRITGNAAGNRLLGLGSADTLRGEGGDDSLDGGTGADRAEGGAGNDTIAVDDPADIVVETPNAGVDLVRATLSWTLSDHVDNLTLLGAALAGTGNALRNRIIGTDGANSLSGLGGADSLEGGAGADTLDGGEGADRLIGGEGNDLYFLGAGDAVLEGIGAGADTVIAARSYAMTATIEEVHLAGAETANASGNALDNRMVGNDAANRFKSAGGADTIEGGGGADVLDGGTEADLLKGGGGNDFYRVDNPGDVIVEASGEGRDTVFSSVEWTLADHVEDLFLSGGLPIGGTGNGLDNRIKGNGFANLLKGDAGADTLEGLGGADTTEGGLGDDVHLVNSTLDRVVEAPNEGLDTVRSLATHTLALHVENLVLTGLSAIGGAGNTADNTVTGNNAANRLRGLDGRDTLNGLDGADTLEGGNDEDRLAAADGDDLLVGGAAADTLNGGLGLDVFRFGGPADFGDRITDFTPVDDVIEVSSAGSGGALPLGVLAGARFVLNGGPTAAGAQFLYNSVTGVLGYDIDGTGAAVAQTVATLTTKPLIGAGDIFVIV